MVDTASFTPAPISPTLLAAELALQSVQDDPAAARERCMGLLAELGPPGRRAETDQTMARAVALWALGRAEYELGNLRESRARLRAAIDMAHRLVSATQLAALSLASAMRASLAVTLLELGDTTGALQQLADALPHASPDVRGRVLQQRAFIWYTLGRFDTSLADADVALGILEETGDQLGVARLLINRGICHLAMGSLVRAEHDLNLCRRLAAELDQHLIVAACDQNLGCVYTNQRRLPEALRALAQAREEYGRLGSPGRVMAALDADLAAALLAAGLHQEAVEAARRSFQQATDQANRVQLAEAQLVMAHALAAAGLSAEAAAHASAARRLFHRSQRHGAGTFAEYSALEAAAAELDRDVDRDVDTDVDTHRLTTAAFRQRSAQLRRAGDLVGELDRFGWRLEAAHARTLAGALACATGDLVAARRWLTGVAGRQGSASQQVRRLQARAQLALLEGDVAGCRRYLRSGLAAVAEQRALLGATELRAQSAANASRLALTGLRLALDGGRAREVLEWSEHGRAASLRSVPVRPPDDPHIAELLTQLRQAQQRRFSDLVGPEPTWGDCRIVELERRIIERTRQLPGANSADRRLPSLTTLRERLGDQILISFHEHGGQLGAVVVHRGRATLHHLAPVTQVTDEIAYVDSAVRRSLISGPRHGPAAGWRVAGERLNDLLIRPLLGTAGRRSGHPVVVVPTGALHSVCWGVLPDLRDRAFVIAPSVSAWFHRGPPTARPLKRRIGIAVGPGLPGAEREGRLVADLHAGADVLLGADASVAATLSLLQRCDLVHLAAHGRFRNDSPLFSSVELNDGPLTVVDLDMLGGVADTIVLPVCNAATASVQAGDELIGPTAALLRLGVRTVVAPGRPIPDEASVDVMLRFHGLLIAGSTAAQALAELRSGSHDDSAALAAALLNCFGAD